MTEKRFHPFAVLHLLRKTILVYLLPLVQVLFARNWAALWAALVQDLVLFALLSAACWAVLHASGWQMDAHGNLLVRWRLGIRLDRTLRADMLAELKALLEQTGFHGVQIHKNDKGWLCVTARK